MHDPRSKSPHSSASQSLADRYPRLAQHRRNYCQSNSPCAFHQCACFCRIGTGRVRCPRCRCGRGRRNGERLWDINHFLANDPTSKSDARQESDLGAASCDPSKQYLTWLCVLRSIGRQCCWQDRTPMKSALGSISRQDGYRTSRFLSTSQTKRAWRAVPRLQHQWQARKLVQRWRFFSTEMTLGACLDKIRS